MSVRHQRRLYRRRRQSRGPHPRQPHPCSRIRRTRPIQLLMDRSRCAPSASTRPAIVPRSKLNGARRSQLESGPAVFQIKTNNPDHSRFRLTPLKTQAPSTATSVSIRVLPTPPTTPMTPMTPKDPRTDISHTTGIPYSVKGSEQGSEQRWHPSQGTRTRH
jgi:hypothetical protein